MIHRLSIAPMMNYTDRHFRFFMRKITKKTLLYTEMIPMNTILKGDRNKFLSYSECEHPISLQLGGDSPYDLAECAKIGEDFGYDEINLNVGCPSERVQTGNFGACLMATPELVSDIVSAMKASVKIPVTVKHRIGIDGKETYEDLYKFVHIVKQASCDGFIVHARIAILKGLSPKENRTIPPLRYEDVYRLKKDFYNTRIEINGGIKSLEEAEEHLTKVDSVMIGRAAYDNPYLFIHADSFLSNEKIEEYPSREEILLSMIPYIEENEAMSVPARRIVNHMLGIFHGVEGNKKFKQFLSTEMPKAISGSKLIHEALNYKEEVQNVYVNH
ncbi:MAG: tRNA dihydrouridine(20/20a) synthase DusA [Leptospiraceae bacterium]|nr:tRNA dihydrouridine(20/20a) synthase DusA [Leptospiraceae bacterium]